MKKMIALCLCLLLLSGCKQETTVNCRKIDENFDYSVEKTTLKIKTRDFVDSMECQIKIDYDNKDATFYSYGLFDEAHLLTQGKHHYLMVEYYGDNDDRFFQLYKLDGSIELLEDYDNMKCINFDEKTMETFIFVSRIDALSSYEVQNEYVFKDGVFESIDEHYDVVSILPELKLLRDLPVTFNNKQTTIKAGKSISLKATDNQSYVDVECEGEVYRINYTRKDYEIFIDGISEYEYFETLYYAG